MRLLLLLCALSASVPALAVDYVSLGSGDWGTSETWLPAGIPGAGDRVTIAKGHVVTIPVGFAAVIGDSPADDNGTPSIQCSSMNGRGVLVINGSLKFKGPVRQCNSTWTVGAGAQITHDSSAATTPSTANYTWQLGMVNGQVDSKLVVSGTSDSRVKFDIAEGSGNAGGFEGGTLSTQDAGQVQATFADFDSWGVATGYFIRAYPYTSGAATYFDYCNISNSGQISLYGIRPDVTFRLLGTTTVDPVVPASGRYVNLGYGTYLTATPTGGDLRIENSYIEGMVSLTVNSNLVGGDAGFRFLNSVFAGTTTKPPLFVNQAPAFAAGNWDLMVLLNRVQSSADPSSLPAGTLKRTILTRNYATNPHWVFLSTQDTVIDGWIAEAEVDNGSYGDIFQLAGSTTGSYGVSILNGITPPTPGGEAPGVVVNYSTSTSATCNGSTNFCPAITVEYNTYLGDARGLIGVGGENNSGGSGLFASVQYNIVWRTTPGEGYITKWYPTATPVAGTYTVADNNTWWNFTNANRYGLSDTNPPVYLASPGLADRHEDPQFVEWRNILQWGQRLKPSVSSWDEIMAEFRNLNQSDHDSHFSIVEMYNWIRAGYRPRNAAAALILQNSGSQVGAIHPYQLFEASGQSYGISPGFLVNNGF